MTLPRTSIPSPRFRWTSNLDGRFNYVAGLYYLDEDSERTEQYRLLIPGAVGGGYC